MTRTNQLNVDRRNDQALARHVRRGLLALLAVGTALIAPTAGLAQPLRHVDFNASRPEIVAQLGAVPAHELRRVYLACARESNQRLLEPGEAVVCTTVADTLLAREFHGNFEALLAWWRAQRDEPLALRR